MPECGQPRSNIKHLTLLTMNDCSAGGLVRRMHGDSGNLAFSSKLENREPLVPGKRN